MQANPYQVCILGLGYIGLPTAAILSQHGYQIKGVDINPKVVETINQGKIHIVEPDLDLVVSEAVHNQKLSASTTPSAADIFIICVPTPFHKNDNGIPQPNIDYVLAAAQSIIPVLKPGNIVILESTSPVGTTEKVGEIFNSAGLSPDHIHLAYCPERVLPGKILQELIHNDRVVGGLTPAATTLVQTFYQTFCQGQILTTDARTAELCKLTENAYRDVNLAFANQLSMLCPHLGIDVRELIHLANHHPRVNILQPGCGVGGHCIAVDPWFIAAADSENTSLIQTARHINDSKPQWVVQQIITLAQEFQQKYHRAPTIGCFGLAFKPNVDDLRGSPALEIATTLISSGYSVLVVEPNLQYHVSLELTPWKLALENADILVFLVGHREFIGLDLANKPYLDFCGIH
ncbi:UDP-N-acetyl-D-mannosamine dehydrogenase [Cylindrospermopsis curvispora]|uniref:UDP-N-acetyl-D-mannosamine dehydrogenase n=1 Tax=Cylindrospermopsis curvispora GIHE-G1 TaxID=2666332 RepID=A0A7H0F1I6_9CYAN|nr:UDP-N-acetyl-D-mannosamine dehydrogenase [Cylindrospermopsis curvispora]QNP29902.1 UDP-N-acetyl-D-mannosamine dehydrogenase [Cylindrospermopsis curvispora GIHE-G1]